MAMDLNKKTVEGLQVSGSEYKVTDKALRGFHVRVRPNGRKVFAFQFRDNADRVCTVRIGEYGTVTVPQAREKALELRAQVDASRRDPSQQDPAAKRRGARKQARAALNAPTVAEVVSLFLEDRENTKKHGTVSEYRRLMNREVLPRLGGIEASELTTLQVQRLHRSMKARPYVANRVLTVLSAAFTYAERIKVFPAGRNPCRNVTTFREESRQRFLNAEELLKVGEVLSRAEREGLRSVGGGAIPVPANPYHVAALRLLILTGWRRNEALSLRWDAVDFKTGTVTLEDTKTGKSIRKIGNPAIELLCSLPRMQDHPYCFPGSKPGEHVRSIRRLWDDVRTDAGLTDVRLHDLRHTFASVAASNGLSMPIIASMLGHRELSTTQKYAHLADDPRKAAADTTAAIIAGMMEPPTQAPVIPLRQQA